MGSEHIRAWQAVGTIEYEQPERQKLLDEKHVPYPVHFTDWCTILMSS
jgi:hypothetical protein